MQKLLALGIGVVGGFFAWRFPGHERGFWVQNVAVVGVALRSFAGLKNRRRAGLLLGVLGLLAWTRETLGIASCWPYGCFGYSEILGEKIGTVPWSVFWSWSPWVLGWALRAELLVRGRNSVGENWGNFENFWKKMWKFLGRKKFQKNRAGKIFDGKSADFLQKVFWGKNSGGKIFAIFGGNLEKIRAGREKFLKFLRGIFGGNFWKIVVVGATGLMLSDLVLDPVAVALGFWRFAEAGLWRGIPATNFAGRLLSGASGLVVTQRILRGNFWGIFGKFFGEKILEISGGVSVGLWFGLGFFGMMAGLLGFRGPVLVALGLAGLGGWLEWEE